jgi:DNA-binding transcriptional MerR regulator
MALSLDVEDKKITSGELCALTDASYRQLDYWCRVGLISPNGKSTPGSGYYRHFNSDIVDRVKFLVNVSNAFNHSFKTDTLKQIYDRYEEGHIDLGDGITLSWRKDGA